MKVGDVCLTAAILSTSTERINAFIDYAKKRKITGYGL